ncbi:hypothetical protein AB0D12_04085 [Streptomyces sp. NPDC048479]|uniref:hypothetical protein n=1 Tax=Streptomyces sp. NPDC048479 TaxID=3154725 RepID=UPI00343B9827
MPAYRLELSEAGEPLAVPSQSNGRADLPEGFGAAEPVASGAGRAATLAADALRTALRPLGPLLDEVHGAVSASESPPPDHPDTHAAQRDADRARTRLGSPPSGERPPGPKG